MGVAAEVSIWGASICLTLVLRPMVTDAFRSCFTNVGRLRYPPYAYGSDTRRVSFGERIGLLEIGY